jgi:hypothetical protein
VERAVEFGKHDVVFQRNKLTLFSLHNNIDATDSSETLVHIYKMYVVLPRSPQHRINIYKVKQSYPSNRPWRPVGL